MGLFGKNKKYIEQDYLRECIQECMRECVQGEVREYTQGYIRDCVQGCAEEIVSGEGGELIHALGDRLDAVEKSAGSVEKQVKRQSEAVEDLIDELQGKDAAIVDYGERLQEKQKREEALVLLICDLQRQLSMLEERVCQEPMADEARREAWQKQFGLMREQLAVREKLCAVEEAGAEGEHVDYRIHEVIRVLDTDEESRAGTVARVHSRGLVYEGKVIMKAEVDAFKCEKKP